MNKNIEKRVFLVGCPRSGTTLLQSLLAAHPKITSFPESDFLAGVTSLKPLLRRFGIARRRASENFSSALRKIDCGHLEHHKPKFSFLLKNYVQSFVSVLDEATLEQSKKIWIEKTPRHLHFVEEIERAVPDAKFIHIVRNGSDVVASMYEVTHEYPEIWDGVRDIDRCISRWVNDVRLSKGYVNRHNHTLTQYENLVTEPERFLRELCNFIGVEFVSKMLSDYSSASQKVISKHEAWKSSVENPISSANSRKFYKIFNAEERDYILQRTNFLEL